MLGIHGTVVRECVAWISKVIAFSPLIALAPVCDQSLHVTCFTFKHIHGEVLIRPRSVCGLALPKLASVILDIR